MFLIRDEQFASLRQHRMETMVRHAEAHVRTFYPKVVAQLGQNQLEQTLREALEAAHACGFVSVAEALKFVNLTMELGRGFQQCTPYAEIVQATGLSAGEKVFHVRRRMAFAAVEAR